MSDRPDGSPTAVDVVLRPEWAAKVGTDKNLTVQQGNVAPALMASGAYLCPAGKTLYVTQIAYYGAPIDLGVDGEKSHHVFAELLVIGVGWLFFEAHESGNSLPLNKPAVITAGMTLTYRVQNISGHNLNLGIVVNGYEV